MLTSDFNFDLPKNLIAQNPAVPRDQSRLLVYDSKNDKIYHEKFRDIVNYLTPDDVIVLNRSKVVPARIKFVEGGRRREIFLLNSLGESLYEVLVKPGRSFKLGRRFFVNDKVNFTVEEIKNDGKRILRCNLMKNDLEAILDEIGEAPLPPYINQTSATFGQYQTVFAREKGSVAAPTAGLHFTEDLLDQLKKFGVGIEEVILHVGLGTFLPVDQQNVQDHVMHKERFFLSVDTAKRLNIAYGKARRVVAVGTTSVRVLENCFDGEFRACDGSTDIFIYPGNHKWKAVDALITNFHLPKSTLLMLVASFLESKGIYSPVKKILELYQLAIKNRYRFYSFGDAMFIY